VVECVKIALLKGLYKVNNSDPIMEKIPKREYYVMA
jgi:hypothetical protein